MSASPPSFQYWLVVRKNCASVNPRLLHGLAPAIVHCPLSGLPLDQQASDLFRRTDQAFGVLLGLCVATELPPAFGGGLHGDLHSPQNFGLTQSNHIARRAG